MVRVIPAKYTDKDIYNAPPNRGSTFNLPSVAYGQLVVPTATSLVRFASLAQMSRHQAEPLPHSLGPQPGILDRVVLNITFHPDDKRRGFRPWRPTFTPPRGRETVYIFHRAARMRVWGEVGRAYTMNEMQRLGIGDSPVFPLLDKLAYRLTRQMQGANGIRQAVIVGVEALESSWTRRIVNVDDGDQQGAFLAHCRRHLENHLGILGENPAREGTLTSLLGRITFMSLEEYRASVGPERAALETAQSGAL
jgi:hypothetical protein